MDYKPIDHINNDTKNNKKSNLRKTEHVSNARNRKSKNSNNKSGFRNVFWNTKDERWLCKHPNLCITTITCYPNLIMFTKNIKTS